MGTSEYTIQVGPIVEKLKVVLKLDHFGEWTASIVGWPCVGDGSSKDEAIGNAVALYLHILIRRIQAGQWVPPIRRA